jgi:hypothetical protein
MKLNNNINFFLNKQKNNLNSNFILKLEFKIKRRDISKYKRKFNNDFTKTLKEEDNELFINNSFNSKLNKNSKKKISLIKMIKEDKKNNMKLKDKNEEKKKNKENKENKKSQENERKNGKYLHLYLGDLFSNRRTFSPLNEYESKDYKKKKKKIKIIL